MKESLRFSGNLIFILFLGLLLFSFAMFQGGFTSWFLFYSFLPIFVYHLGLLFYPIKNWEVTRNLSHHVIRSGDGVTGTIRIRRSIPFPLYYCICEEILPDTLKKAGNHKDNYRNMAEPAKLNFSRDVKKIIFPSARRVMEISYKLDDVPRGDHHLQAIRVKTGDVFGFVKKEHIFDLRDQLVAYPNERPIHLNEKVSSSEEGATASYTLNLKNTNVVSGIREYAPGDKFSWIDWKQTARKNKVMTKEFEQEKSTDILVVLDSCASEGMNPLAFEASVEMTVSLMASTGKQSTQVGLLTIGEKVVYFPKHDSSLNDSVNQHLTRIQPTGSKPFPMKLKEELFKVGHGNIVMLLTTRIDHGFKDSMQQLKKRSKKVIVLLILPAEKISRNEHMLIQQLKSEGVDMRVLTEKELMKTPIEVSRT
ncbi:uncharacterized protein (DUF58 family) [Virgibacillus natechei]|uniref:Uncharacterized protein (DUF58 family) n=1 Tax=Virgibacillus natechei TaxID=1216297 RepID=A0ABS4IHM3_9BACI|nr:DUF58 domain-containing protein [Virgibacillus natechei]MBP1970447.1 uncharacterized protein (DUF58 family) [Virgibacillus natechei]UZD13902.1 DUF58 domain-containing protein [Virgibacillus natechei]